MGYSRKKRKCDGTTCVLACKDPRSDRPLATAIARSLEFIVLWALAPHPTDRLRYALSTPGFGPFPSKHLDPLTSHGATYKPRYRRIGFR